MSDTQSVYRAVGWTCDDGANHEVHVFAEGGADHYCFGFNTDLFTYEEVRKFLREHNVELAPRVPRWRRVLRAIVG